LCSESSIYILIPSTDDSSVEFKVIVIEQCFDFIPLTGNPLYIGSGVNEIKGNPLEGETPGILNK